MAEVDAIETNFANAVGMVMAEGGSGTFTVGETVTGGTTNTTAEVKSWDPATRTLILINRSGRFSSGETMTGDTSSAVWSTFTYNTINNVNSDYDQNQAIEYDADAIIDFTQSNPFGEFGNKGSTI